MTPIEFEESILAAPMIPGSQGDHLRYAMDYIEIDGLCVEFGVWIGTTMRYIADYIYPYSVYGFDWWKGLPESWTWKIGDSTAVRCLEGNFALDKIPAFRDNVILVNGLVEDTLPLFCNRFDGLFSFIHIDLDLYNPTMYVLEYLMQNKRIVPGTILAFDEIVGHPANIEHEYQVMLDLFAARPEFEVEAISRRDPNENVPDPWAMKGEQVAFRVARV